MIDLSYLKTTTENDPNVIKELIKLFIDQLPDLKKNILNSYESKNWKAMKEAAHKAKSSFQIIGAYTQAEELKQMEIMAVENHNKKDYDILIKNFKITCNEVLVELNKVISNLELQRNL
jgi:HPt (histidine-containing phosphotransfer) domain-containing protein